MKTTIAEKMLVLALIAITLMAATKAPIQQTIVETKAVVVVRSWQATQIISDETKQGWKLTNIVCQTTDNAFDDIIIVFERKKQ